MTLKRDQVYRHELPGAGGWGDPLERDAQSVAWDVVEELVSREGARQHYGVVLKSDLSLDVEATNKLRQEMKAKRPVAA